ncbi:MAG: PAS domain S-box protein [Haloarculaceae archaeon]
MSETTDDQHTRSGVFADRSSISVVYVAVGTEGTSVSTDLERVHGMDVRVATSLPQALSWVAADGDLDCVVTESTEAGTVERTLVEEGRAREPALPVVVYADAGADPGTYRDYIDDGIVDYLSRGADTDERRLLARRIEHCVALQRERKMARDLRMAVDRMGHGVLIADTDGTIEYVNPAFKEIGYAPETLEGQPISTLQSADGDTTTSRTLWETVTDGGRWSGELAVDTPEGERIVDLTASPIRQGGDVRRIVAVGDDVTERKRREQRRRSFREAVEQAGHVIMITDTDGEIEYVNPAFEAVTGYDREEALGETPAILQSGEHDDAFYRELWETISSGAVWEGELVNERKSGESYHIRQTVAPVTDEDGEIERFVAVNTDITDHKRHEQQLKRERDRLNEFARTIAHDLRNPLSVALGTVDLARDEYDAPDDILDRAIDALERMDTLIGEVLTLAEQGQTIHQPEPVNFSQVLQRAWQDVETPDATLTVDEDFDDVSIDADKSRLCELLENLLRNAVEHAGPDVTIRVGRTDGQQGFFVADDGPGVSPHDRGRIFEGGVTTSEDGTGFGLAIVTQIVEAHGWEIDVVESDDGGARFEITTDTVGSQATDGGESP